MDLIQLYDKNVVTETVVDLTQQKIDSADAGHVKLLAIPEAERTAALNDALADVKRDLDRLQAIPDTDHDRITIHLRTLLNADRMLLSQNIAECEWSGPGFERLMMLIGDQIVKIDGYEDAVAGMDGGMAEFLQRIKDADIQRALVRAVSDHCTMPVEQEKN